MSRHIPGAANTSVYVHVPFCVVKCGYCDFNSWRPDGTEPLDRFLVALEQELQQTALPAAPVSVFIGGGTPTYLDEVRFAQLCELLSTHLDLTSVPEVSMEANPESVTAAKIEAALASGIRRFSMGVQSFHADHLRFLDRAHSADDARRAFGVLRTAGAKNVSLDLIFGLPDQSLEEWQSDLEQALQLDPDHLSCYHLTFEPGTRLTRDVRQGRVQPGDEDLALAMFAWTRNTLVAAGFDAYEISNFAGRGGPCLHNDHYWLQGDYAGFGPGASSHRQGVRTTNYKALDRWADALDLGHPPIAEAETLTPLRRAGEALWLGMRRRAGVQVEAVVARLDAPEIETTLMAIAEPLLAAGWVARDSAGALALTDQGVLQADTVGEAFLMV